MTGVVVWITGLPSSGKSTFAERAAATLRERSVACCILDGDAVRHALGDVFGYGDEARDRYYEALARLAALVASQGLITLVPATASQRAFRERARSLAPAFLEVHVDVDLAECARRDAKGLYAAVARGEAKNLPGVDAPFERPESPDLVAHGGQDQAAVDALIEKLGCNSLVREVSSRSAFVARRRSGSYVEHANVDLGENPRTNRRLRGDRASTWLATLEIAGRCMGRLRRAASARG